jgi:predicted transcriptional regulator
MALTALGLTQADSRIYTVLVAHPQSTSSELADACGVSPVAAGRVLGRLTRMGLARKISERPVRYLAVTPDVAISDLINRREAELNRARTVVHELMDTHREASGILHPDMAVDVLTDRDDISAMARRIQADARVQVRGFDRPPYIDRPGSNLGVQVERQRRGVRHRVVYDRAAVALRGRLEQDIMPSARAGEQARVRPELPLKLILCDDRMGIIPFSIAPRGEAAAYAIYGSSLLAALSALFEAEWDRAVPLSDLVSQRGDEDASARPSHDDEPDDDTRNLLTLLAAGLTDDAIARSLGWSSRTTQRRLQRLMTTLGASTRFQAGLLATRRGWA